MSLSPDAVRLLQDSIARMTGVRASAEDAASIHELIPPPGAAAPRTSARDPNRTVTILLTDLRGITAFSEMIPECEVFDVLNRHLCRMCEIAVSNGGMIDKFIGDSVMVLFGIEEHGEKDALSAVTCAVQMQSAMDEFNRENSAIGLAPLYMGIGIHTGRVAAGRLGSSLHSEFTVIGQEVSLASRIESFSLRGQVLVSEATYDLCARWLETSEPMDVQVKGKKMPCGCAKSCRFLRLASMFPTRTSARARASRSICPLTIG